jgi:hypothetical protein
VDIHAGRRVHSQASNLHQQLAGDKEAIQVDMKVSPDLDGAPAGG